LTIGAANKAKGVVPADALRSIARSPLHGGAGRIGV